MEYYLKFTLNTPCGRYGYYTNNDNVMQNGYNICKAFNPNLKFEFEI